MFMNSDRYFSYPFFYVFCAEVHPVRRQKSRHVYNTGGNHQRRKREPDLKSETEMLGVVGILRYCAN